MIVEQSTGIESSVSPSRKRSDGWELAVLAADAGVWDWRPGTNDMYWSPYLNSLLGYADGELSPDVPAFNVLLHPDDARSLWDSINSHLRGGLPIHEVEIRLRHKNGSYRWVLSRGTAIRDAEGKPIRMAGLHLGMTTRKTLREESGGGARTTSVQFEEVVSNSVHCKRCGSAEVARSRPQKWDFVLSAFMLRALRCRTCGHRFYRPRWMHTAA